MTDVVAASGKRVTELTLPLRTQSRIDTSRSLLSGGMSPIPRRLTRAPARPSDLPDHPHPAPLRSGSARTGLRSSRRRFSHPRGCAGTDHRSRASTLTPLFRLARPFSPGLRTGAISDDAQTSAHIECSVKPARNRTRHHRRAQRNPYLAPDAGGRGRLAQRDLSEPELPVVLYRTPRGAETHAKRRLGGHHLLDRPHLPVRVGGGAGGSGGQDRAVRARKGKTRTKPRIAGKWESHFLLSSDPAPVPGAPAGRAGQELPHARKPPAWGWPGPAAGS